MIENTSSYVLPGFLFVLAHIVIRHLFSAKLGDKNSDKNNRTTNFGAMMFIGGSFFAGGVFMTAYFYTSLSGAIFYKILLSIWGGVRTVNGDNKNRQWPIAAKVASAISLGLVLFWENVQLLHIYGVVMFILMFGFVAWKILPEMAEIEGGGAMNKIKIVSIMIVVFVAVLGGGEILWRSGGLDLWIWFFAFTPSIVFLSLVPVVVIVQTFLEAVNDTSRSL